MDGRLARHEGDQGMYGDTQAQWLLDAVAQEGVSQGIPFTEDELSLLSSPMSAVPDERRGAVIDLNNRVVRLARAAMIRAKANGASTVKARRGLVIPAEWFNNYNITYAYNHPWLISLMMQNAMLTNVSGGETAPWTSK